MLSPSACLLLLLFVLLLPTAVFYAQLSSSMALGATVAAALATAITWSPCLMQGAAGARLMAAPLTVVGLVLAAIALHASFAVLAMPFDAGRAVQSVLPLLLLLMAGRGLAGSLLASPPSALNSALWVCLLLLLLMAGVAIAGVPVPMAASYYKPVFPFTEPSHYAELLAPILLYCCVVSRGPKRVAILAVGALIAALLQSMTLALACIIVAAICFRLLLGLPLLIIAAFAASQVDLSYYTGRLNIGSDSQNLSSLVYLQGWQMLSDAFSATYGWGLGFQQLGVGGATASIADQILALSGGYMNVFDGSFMLSKLGSEFGYFGLVMVTIYLVLAWRAIRDLRRASRQPHTADATVVFANAVLATYVLEIFVRAGGYFTGGSILLVAALWIVAIEHNRIRKSTARVRRS